MAYVDLGNPIGLVVSGIGAEQLAHEVGGVASGVDPEAYSSWFEGTRCGQIAPECGALALANTEDHETQLYCDHDDFGGILASTAGSGSI